MSNQQNSSSGGFVPKDMTGILFYDAPGAPTLKGSVQKGQSIEVTGEPAVDKNQVQYTKVTGNNVMGGLYPNDRKTSEKHPDFTGPIRIQNEELRVSAWVRQTKSGESAGSDYLSLSIQPPFKKKDN